MNTRKREYIITWFIENYSYCWHRNEESLRSPEFSADGLEDTVWYLEIYPRGSEDENKGNVSLYLSRSENDDGPEEFPVVFELSILAADGKVPLIQKSEKTLKKGHGYGLAELVELKEIFFLRKSEYLPQDTLGVCVKIKRGEGNIQHVKEIIFRTRIGIQQIAFHHEVEDFSALQQNEKKTIQIRSPSKEGLALTSRLYFTGDSCCEKIIIEIASSSTNHILSKCKLSILNSSGVKIECGEIDNRFDAERKDIQKLPLSLTRTVILKRKDKYLPDDKLFLLCECVFSTGIEFEKIERTLHELPFKALNHISNYDKDIYTEKLFVCPSGLDDLYEVYNDGFLTDVELKTKTKSFPAHKIVLCARSFVFKAMLSNDMKEKNTNCIEVADLENVTVQQLLLFLYSDKLEDLEWQSANELYYAADKYAIEKLKLQCSSFLVDNLSTSTAGELLLLADTHQDSDLKKLVEDFIFKHEKQVFGSEEWRNLIETNPVLVSKTMCLKYMREL